MILLLLYLQHLKMCIMTPPGIGGVMMSESNANETSRFYNDNLASTFNFPSGRHRSCYHGPYLVH
jgi:hypothetical protein